MESGLNKGSIGVDPGDVGHKEETGLIRGEGNFPHFVSCQRH
jgi:hypothetical protein